MTDCKHQVSQHHKLADFQNSFTWALNSKYKHARRSVYIDRCGH